MRPITSLDVYRHFHAVATMSGAGTMMDGITAARPPAPGKPSAATSGPSAASLKATASGLSAAVRAARGDGELGSNALATGSRGTGGEARSVLLANPHFPWHGARRFWQSHLTVPGRLDVSGASLLGFPTVLIGHNRDLAWTHTVSTAATYGLYEVPLVPGDPTRYLVDGVPEPMRAHRVTVRVRAADGTEDYVERTLWETRYGPVIGTGPGGSPLPWTTRSAHVLRDANAATCVPSTAGSASAGPATPTAYAGSSPAPRACPGSTPLPPTAGAGPCTRTSRSYRTSPTTWPSAAPRRSASGCSPSAACPSSTEDAPTAPGAATPTPSNPDCSDPRGSPAWPATTTSSTPTTAPG